MVAFLSTLYIRNTIHSDFNTTCESNDTVGGRECTELGDQAGKSWQGPSAFSESFQPQPRASLSRATNSPATSLNPLISISQLNEQWHGSPVLVAPPLRAAPPPIRNVLPVTTVTVKATTTRPPPHIPAAPDPVKVTSIASFPK